MGQICIPLQLLAYPLIVNLEYFWAKQMHKLSANVIEAKFMNWTSTYEPSIK